ncbi:hypothetical protein ACGYK5_17815 [Sulfitobacter sp. 1A16787]|uniref:hypothetical protein n=1 Tax=Sulfitobacter sp. 1A16787 TaxID=3368571 RepID=UPI003745ABE8
MTMILNVIGGGIPAWEATITSNQQEMNLATWALAQGWDGEAPVAVTVAAGVYIWSDDTATPALTTGVLPEGSTIIVAGFIMGRGGDGGWWDSSGDQNGVSEYGEDGGPAVKLNSDVSIIVQAGGWICGGGGGGAGGNAVKNPVNGGGGAGGGESTSGGVRQTDGEGWGGAVGMPGNDGYSKDPETFIPPEGGVSGGGGGSTRGAGGGGARVVNNDVTGGGRGGHHASQDGYNGGDGGHTNTPGADGYRGPNSNQSGDYGGGAGGGGGWGAMGGNAMMYTNDTTSPPTVMATGGLGGKAVDLNGHIVGWDFLGGASLSGNVWGAVA